MIALIMTVAKRKYSGGSGGGGNGGNGGGGGVIMVQVVAPRKE